MSYRKEKKKGYGSYLHILYRYENNIHYMQIPDFKCIKTPRLRDR